MGAPVFRHAVETGLQRMFSPEATSQQSQSIFDRPNGRAPHEGFNCRYLGSGLKRAKHRKDGVAMDDGLRIAPVNSGSAVQPVQVRGKIMGDSTVAWAVQPGQGALSVQMSQHVVLSAAEAIERLVLQPAKYGARL